jgi:hypothetical protein
MVPEYRRLRSRGITPGTSQEELLPGLKVCFPFAELLLSE